MPPLDMLIIASVSLNKPVVRYSLFVIINIDAEIIQAIEDYCNERMGNIDF